MKKNFLIIIPVLFAHFAYSQFQYISPSPDSKNLPVEHNIIIRQGSKLDATSVKSSLFSIQGSKSGFHTFKLVLCADGKTINLNPTIPFAFEETVTVSVSKGLMNVEKKVIDDYSFTFTTHREWTADELAMIKSIDSILQANEVNEVNEGEDQDEGDTRKIVGMFTINYNSNPAPGDIFFDCRPAIWSYSQYTSIAIIHSNGDSVFQRMFNPVPYDFQIARNGYLETYQGNINKFIVMDSNFAVIDTYAAANGYEGNLHELVMLENGYAFIFAGEVQSMSVQLSDSSYVEKDVLGTVIQEFDPDKNVVFEWHSLEHVGLDESHHVNFNANPIDYIHTNSIDVDTDGNLIVSHRHINQITKIDVNTGEFIWRLGGDYNQFTFLNDSDQFSWQHDARRIANGNITLYDDGNYHVPSKSYAKEYQLDEVNMTATLVWSYSHPDVAGHTAFYSAMGNVQRLPNGNTFIGWGYRPVVALPSITEVDSAGNIVWELKMSSAQNLIDYRAHKYEWNPCARPTFRLLNTVEITNQSATLTWVPVANPSQQYEVQYKKHVDSVWTVEKLSASVAFLNIDNLDPNTEYDWRIQSWCDTVSGISSHFTDTVNFTTLLATGLNETGINSVALYPNPVNDLVTIMCTFKVSKVRVLNLLGQEVRNFLVNSDQPIQIHISSLSSGNYFVEITGDKTSEVRKLVVE